MNNTPQEMIWTLHCGLDPDMTITKEIEDCIRIAFVAMNFADMMDGNRWLGKPEHECIDEILRLMGREPREWER